MSTHESIQEIKITDKALSQILKIRVENDIPADYALRIGVKGGGCSGMSYDMGFDGEQKEGDTIISKGDLNIYVDGKSLFYLTGTELDFADGLNGKGFRFNNPNAAKTCGCGDSFGV